MNSSSVPKWSIEHTKISNPQTLLALAVAPQPQPNTPRVLIFFFFFLRQPPRTRDGRYGPGNRFFFRTRCLIFYSFTLMSHRLMNRKNQTNVPPFAGMVFFPRFVQRAPRFGLSSGHTGTHQYWPTLSGHSCVPPGPGNIFSLQNQTGGGKSGSTQRAYFFILFYFVARLLSLEKPNANIWLRWHKIRAGRGKNPIYQRGPGWGLGYGIEVTARRWRRRRQRGCEI